MKYSIAEVRLNRARNIAIVRVIYTEKYQLGHRSLIYLPVEYRTLHTTGTWISSQSLKHLSLFPVSHTLKRDIKVRENGYSGGQQYKMSEASVFLTHRPSLQQYNIL